MKKQFLVINKEADDKRYDPLEKDSIFIPRKKLNSDLDSIVDFVMHDWSGDMLVNIPKSWNPEERQKIESVVHAGLDKGNKVKVVLPGKDLLMDIAMDVDKSSYAQFQKLVAEW